MRVALAVAVVALAAMPLAAAARPTARPKPQTLVRVTAPIGGFGQDGSRIAWLTGRNGRRCTRTLHVRSLRTGQTQTAIQTGCTSASEEVSDLGLAGRAAAWDSFVAGGHLEFDTAIVTARVPERRAHRVASIHGTDDGYPVSYPAVAGAGGLLTFSVPTGVRRIVHGRSRKLFAFAKPLDLAVADDRIAVVREELRPGDGCGCVLAPVWTRDGRVAFLTEVEQPDRRVAREVSVVGASGAGRTVLTNDRRFRADLDWSRDGTKIVYSYSRPPTGAWTIAVSAPDGGGAHDLGAGEDPAWSPDGSRIAFTRSDGVRSQIFVMDADGSNVRQLTTASPEAGAKEPAWSPDGGHIVYVGLDRRISVVRADGGDEHRLRSLTGDSPQFSPDGTRIAFSGGTRGGIAVAAADGSGEHAVTMGFDFQPQWSPDGRTLVFASTRNEIRSDYFSTELYLVDADGSHLRPLTYRIPAAWASFGQVRTSAGRLVASFEAAGGTGDVALAGKKVALVTGAGRITLFSAATGAQLASVAAGQLGGLAGANERWVVFETPSARIRALDLRTLRTRTLAVLKRPPIGLSVSGRRVAWAENFPNGARPRARIRALVLPA